jgi:putative redox protein
MVKVRWIENMKFVATGDSNHSIVMDTKKEFGGDESAPSPMEIVLFGLGGCTGMDVVAILKKMGY